MLQCLFVGEPLEQHDNLDKKGDSNNIVLSQALIYTEAALEYLNTGFLVNT
jgi:hypothetical protein